MSPALLHGFAIASTTTAVVLFSLAWRRVRRAELAASGNGDARIGMVWRAALGPLARVLRPRERDHDELLARLQHAGRYARGEVDRFLEEKVRALLIGVTAGLFALLWLGGEIGFLMMLFCFILAFLVPNKLLDAKATERRDAIRTSLPSAIDLLMTCVDSGLSVEQALARVSKEITRSSPILAEELALAASETEAGVALTESLRRMARRVELDDLTGLCSVISQAHELGAPIVDTLADYADSARKLRMAYLEERAGKLATKLTLPLALFLLPAALIAILGPAGIQLMRAIS
jgi:tight adherence protein C